MRPPPRSEHARDDGSTCEVNSEDVHSEHVPPGVDRDLPGSPILTSDPCVRREEVDPDRAPSRSRRPRPPRPRGARRRRREQARGSRLATASTCSVVRPVTATHASRPRRARGRWRLRSRVRRPSRGQRRSASQTARSISLECLGFSSVERSPGSCPSARARTRGGRSSRFASWGERRRR